MRFSHFFAKGIIITVPLLAISCSLADSKKSVDESAMKEQVVRVADSTEKQTENTIQKNRQLVVYYFMGNYRCPSCMYIEKTTKATVNEVFSDQLKSGRVVFSAINIDEEPNKHYEKDYKLFSQSVIISDIKDGKELRWANLEKVWQLLNDDKRFKEYIIKEIKKYLEE
jgi:thiol-disulfide isomerase/thioredoxin